MLVTRGDACTVFAVWAFDVLSACYPVTAGITSEDPDAGKALEPVRGQPAAIVGGQMREYQVVDFEFSQISEHHSLKDDCPQVQGLRWLVKQHDRFRILLLGSLDDSSGMTSSCQVRLEHPGR
jgi:hypothetical protein